MTIQDISLQPSFVLAPEVSAAQAVRAMLKSRINHLAVCEGRHVVGIVSIADILKQLIPPSARQPDGAMDLKFAGDAQRLLTANLKKLEDIEVGSILQSLPLIQEDCPLLEAALLLFKNAGPLVVVDAAGDFKGMLSCRTFVEYLTTQAEQ